MKVELEFYDGTGMVIGDVLDEWEEVRLIEAAGGDIKSAWRDDEPWFGECTDMREGTP